MVKNLELNEIFAPDRAVRLRKLAENFVWYLSNEEPLIRLYADSYVAIFRKSVVGHDKDQPKLVKAMIEQYPRKEDFDTICITYVRKEKLDIILKKTVLAD